MAVSPTPDLMDPLGLFTHGEFLCFDSEDPELLLFTHGEFPRPAVRAPSRGPSDAGQGSGGKRRRKPQEQVACINDDIEIAIALLMADDDDDWDSWF